MSVRAEGKKRLVLDSRHVNPHLFKYKLLGQCPDYAHARASSVFFSKKDNIRTSDRDLFVYITFSNLNEPTAMKVTSKNPVFAQIESIDL